MIRTIELLNRDEYIAVVAALKALLAVAPKDDPARPALESALTKLEKPWGETDDPA